jgi:hypothetical protein
MWYEEFQNYQYNSTIELRMRNRTRFAANDCERACTYVECIRGATAYNINPTKDLELNAAVTMAVNTAIRADVDYKGLNVFRFFKKETGFRKRYSAIIYYVRKLEAILLKYRTIANCVNEA